MYSTVGNYPWQTRPFRFRQLLRCEISAQRCGTTEVTGSATTVVCVRFLSLLVTLFDLQSYKRTICLPSHPPCISMRQITLLTNNGVYYLIDTRNSLVGFGPGAMPRDLFRDFPLDQKASTIVRTMVREVLTVIFGFLQPLARV
jgi:hypothetical protein